jgi:glycosyltransferase involved in cell wall biosynthesis
MLFSVVIATYNQEDLVRDAVDSVLNQSYGESFELIVIDDCSKDDTYGTLLTYGNRIRLVENETNRGAIYTRNLGATMAKGEYVVFLDGDDVLLPWALETYANVIAHESPVLLIGELLWCDRTIPAVTREQYESGIRFVAYDALVRKDRSQGGGASAIVVSQEGFGRSGGWHDGMWPMEVDDFCLHLGCEKTVQVISPPTAGYRMHGNNTFGDVQRFAEMMLHIVENESAGVYPGGRDFRRDRRAFVGGKLFYWLRNAVKSKCFLTAGRLLWDGWPMIVAAMLHRLRALLRGRQEAVAI